MVQLESLQILFVLAAHYGLTAYLLDATNAFVGSQVNKQIFMEVPEGIKPDKQGQVCKIL